MQNHLNKIAGKTFRYCGQLYKVGETKMVNHKAVIKTDRQTFVKTESELSEFMEDIEFVDAKAFDNVQKFPEGGIVPGKEWKPSNEIVLKSSPLQSEIWTAESNAAKVSNKLMEVFNSLADNPTEETFKKAAAMVNVSNSIVNIQMAQIKFLSLKK